MEAGVSLCANDSEYIDVDVYVREEDKSEWRFMVSKNKSLNAICYGGYCFAESEHAGFEETDKEPSPEVWGAVIEAIPKVLDVIRKAEEV